MATTSSSALTISSSSTLFDGKSPRHSLASSPQCVSLPSLTLQSKNRALKTTTAHCMLLTKACTCLVIHKCCLFIGWCFSGRKIGRNVVAMATGEAPAEVTTTETPEFVKTLQEAVRINLQFYWYISCGWKMEFSQIYWLKISWCLLHSGTKLMINMHWVHWL